MWEVTGVAETRTERDCTLIIAELRDGCRGFIMSFPPLLCMFKTVQSTQSFKRKAILRRGPILERETPLGATEA